MGGVDRLQPFDSLDLHDDGSFDEEIDPVADKVQRVALVGETQSLLAFDIEAAAQEFEREARFVGLLEQSWAKFPMYF